MTVKEFIINVAIVNESSILTDAQVYACTYALQIQTKCDFYPIWGIASHVYFAPKGTVIPAGHSQLIILDTADQAGALGYHDLTSTGDPLGKVFAKTTMDAGEQWTVTASHELLEMLVDPYINLTVFLQNSAFTGRLMPYEVCDAVQGDLCTYPIPSAGNIVVSDFVTPAWFEDFRQPNSARFDFKNLVTQPFEIYKGGYMSFFSVTAATGWQQSFAEKLPTQTVGDLTKADHSKARNELRSKQRSQWKLSTPR